MSEINKSAINDLVAGYKQFKSHYLNESATFANLAQHGQKPKVLVIACCDSRVDPAILTNSELGDLFVVRNIANLVPPFNSDSQHHGTSAALEFGVLALNVTDIVILGHSNCGGIRALVETNEQQNDTSDFIHAWLNIAKEAKQQVMQQSTLQSLEAKAHQCEKESLRISLNNLTTFPWIKERIAQNKLFIHAWYFNLDKAAIEAYDSKKNRFEML